MPKLQGEKGERSALIEEGTVQKEKTCFLFLFCPNFGFDRNLLDGTEGLCIFCQSLYKKNSLRARLRDVTFNFILFSQF